jgi:hypothetical protein
MPWLGITPVCCGVGGGTAISYRPRTLQNPYRAGRAQAALAALRPHAVLVNIGRGKTLDEDALVEGACAALAGAALPALSWPPMCTLLMSPGWRPANFATARLCSARHRSRACCTNRTSGSTTHA